MVLLAVSPSCFFFFFWLLLLLFLLSQDTFINSIKTLRFPQMVSLETSEVLVVQALLLSFPGLASPLW